MKPFCELKLHDVKRKDLYKKKLIVSILTFYYTLNQKLNM